MVWRGTVHDDVTTATCASGTDGRGQHKHNSEEQPRVIGAALADAKAQILAAHAEGEGSDGWTCANGCRCAAQAWFGLWRQGIVTLLDGLWREHVRPQRHGLETILLRPAFVHHFACWYNKPKLGG